MKIEIAYLITLVFGAVGFIGGIYGMSRNRKHDLQKDMHETANIAFELKALQNGLAEFKTEIRLTLASNGEMTLDNHDKIIKLEANQKTLFARYDELKEKIK